MLAIGTIDKKWLRIGFKRGDIGSETTHTVHRAVQAITQNKEKRGQKDARSMFPAHVVYFIYRGGYVRFPRLKRWFISRS